MQESATDHDVVGANEAIKPFEQFAVQIIMLNARTISIQIALWAVVTSGGLAALDIYFMDVSVWSYATVVVIGIGASATVLGHAAYRRSRLEKGVFGGSDYESRAIGAHIATAQMLDDVPGPLSEEARMARINAVRQFLLDRSKLPPQSG